MSYNFQSRKNYRMPTHFGPALGPRQGIEGRRFANVDRPFDTTLQATFSADKTQLEKLLPPGFTARAPYTVSFSFSYITQIEWLAGRGYNTFGITVPVTYHGDNEIVHGELLWVIWENMADPIITGREDLGFAKIYCEIPEPQPMDNDIICRASWDGFEFSAMTFKNLQEVTAEEFPADPEGCEPSSGTLHYKYFPKTGCPGEADVAYAALTPADWPNLKIEQAMLADTAIININKATWEQLPTQVHIVNTLAELTLGKCTSATLVKMRGSKDLSDTRILT